MKVLLINPPVSFDELFAGGGKEVGGNLPPLGIAYIAAYLEKNGIFVRIIDGMVDNKKVDDIAKMTKEFDVVGITSITFFALRAYEQAAAIKKLFPDKIVIMGGPHPTAMPQEVLSDGNIDVVVMGEGELTTLELVKHIEKKGLKDLDKIDGIAFRKKEKVKITKERKLIFKLDEIPFPARHLLPMNKYFAAEVRSKNHPALSIISSRGCPNNCTYCGNETFFRNCWRAFSAEYVVNEIEELIKKYGAKEINFWDDNFMLNRQRVLDICRLLKEKGIKIPIEASGRVDSIDLELLKEMKKAGFYFLGFGVESGSERILKDVNKNITKQQIRNAYTLCKKVSIMTRGYFMLGFIGETKKEMLETIDFARELNPDFATFTLLAPLPGTKDFKRAQQEGKFDKDYYKKEICPEINFPKHPYYIPKGFTEEELMNMHKLAYKKFYMRPSYILNQLKSIRSMGDIKKLIKGALTIVKKK